MLILTFLILLSFSAFFSGSETAYVALDKLRLKKLEDMRGVSPERVLRLLKNTHKLIITILIGNMIVNIAASSLLARYLYGRLGEAGLAVSIFAMTIVILVFGEVTPKMLAYSRAVRFSLAVSFLLEFFQIVFTPLRIVLEKATSGIILALRIKVDKVKNTDVTEHDIRYLFKVGQEKGIVKGKETDMLDNVLKFKELDVADIMTPRIEVVALDISSSRDDIAEKIKEEQFARYPAYIHNMDNVVGLVYAKDFLLDTESQVKDMLKDAYYVPESMKVDDLLSDMQKQKQHMAIVTDEYGVTSGLVTIEDILEEIVGEIEDELDFDIPRIRKIDQKTFEVDGQVHINEINEETGIGIKTEEVDTIGGFVTLLAGRIPQSGDVMEINGFIVTVKDVSKNRITLLRMEKISVKDQNDPGNA